MMADLVESASICMDQPVTQANVTCSKVPFGLVSTRQPIPRRNSSITSDAETLSTNLCPLTVNWRSVSPTMGSFVLLATERL